MGKFFSLEFYFGFQNIFSWKFSTWNKDVFSSLATDIVNKKNQIQFLRLNLMKSTYLAWFLFRSNCYKRIIVFEFKSFFPYIIYIKLYFYRVVIYFSY